MLSYYIDNRSSWHFLWEKFDVALPSFQYCMKQFSSRKCHLIYVIHITKLYKTFCMDPWCKNENKSFRRILKCSQGENCVRISDQRFYCTLFFPCLQRSKACCLTIKSFCLLYMFTSSAKQAQVSPSSNSHIFATIFEERKIVVQTPAFPLDLETQH